MNISFLLLRYKIARFRHGNPDGIAFNRWVRCVPAVGGINGADHPQHPHPQLQSQSHPQHPHPQQNTAHVICYA